MAAESTPVVLLMGPTASGKTELAVELVRRLPCEIVSVDSAMVYRGLDIGTAKPGSDILSEAPHRLIDIREPDETYSAGEFRDDAREAIEDIVSHGRVPLLVGGTMLYFRVLQQGIARLPQAAPALREALDERARRSGWPELHGELARHDPQAAARIHPNDAQRIQRALEVLYTTGEPISALQRHRAAAGLSRPAVKIVLEPADRSLLGERIAGRFEQMMASGFLSEVERLYRRPGLERRMPALRAVGYQQLWDFLEGRWTLDEAVRHGIAATRQLARRQLTWLRAEAGGLRIARLDPGRLDPILSHLEAALARASLC